MLEVKNVTKIFSGAGNEVVAVNDISFAVKDGEFLAVQGTSGSGKTTLLHAVGSLEEPDKGEIIINGNNIYSLNHKERTLFRGKNIGFVFQQFHLIPYLTIRENILAASIINPGKNVEKRVDKLIEKFNLVSRANHVPSMLSTGEKQRTAMARAILNEPALLLADEPTGNLDKENAEIILKYFTEYAKSGKMVIMVTHSEDAAAFADREIHLNQGKIVSLSKYI